jgi:hypothetical protein
MISRAAVNALMVCKFLTASGTTSFASSFAGSLHPITPVLEGNTLPAPPGRFSSLATAAHTSSALATPSPPEQTFEILLFITIAWIGLPEERRDRPTLIGDPGNYRIEYNSKSDD